MADDAQDFRDKMRVCPSCRMEISFYATKCRFCGEGVGRPKEETRQLTIHDLGGEHGTDYKPNESVMDALEQFRMEELTRPATPKEGRGSGISKRKSSEGAEDPSFSVLSDFDQRNDDFGSPGTYAARRAARRNEVPLSKKLMWAGVFVASAILLVFFGDSIKGIIEGALSKDNGPKVSVENHALEMLQGGAGKSDALREAVNAASVADTDENRRVLDFVRKDIQQEVEALLNADPWEHSVLEKASKIASQAAEVDHDSSMTILRDKVSDEIFAYSLLVKELEPGSNTVTFMVSLRGREPETQTASVGDMVSERFKVKNVTREYVRLEDTKRKAGRGGNRQICLYKDGTIRAQ